MRYISIHAPREGGDDILATIIRPTFKFQSTPPARGATGAIQRHDLRFGISIHAPREGGDNMYPAKTTIQTISIHAPREGGDLSAPKGYFRFQVISIHAPREGGDCLGLFIVRGLVGFQSTPPARGATVEKAVAHHTGLISIHAPREGGDTTDCYFYQDRGYFNPRPPRGGRQQRCTVLPADL